MWEAGNGEETTAKKIITFRGDNNKTPTLVTPLVLIVYEHYPATLWHVCDSGAPPSTDVMTYLLTYLKSLVFSVTATVRVLSL